MPFLLTVHQGEAARTLLSYVMSLQLKSPDVQLLAVVIAIRAARGGVGNIAGADLSSMRLSSPHDAVGELRGLGWRVPEGVLAGDPDTPVAVAVPDLAVEAERPLPFGKCVRSRVSGWTTRVLSAKPVKKTPPAVRLSALFLAAYASGDLSGRLPEDLPEACRNSLPELLDKGFLASLDDSQYRLSSAVRHLAGLLPHPSAPSQASASPTRAGAEAFEFSEQGWERWKSAASPALERHVAAVEACRVCALPTERVAMAFMGQPTPLPYQKGLTTAYAAWKEEHRDRGPEAARFTVAFRTEHGPGFDSCGA